VGWFRPTVVGEFDLQCAEICGIGHGLMPGRVRIRSAAAQAAWMETAPRMPQRASMTPAVPATGEPASFAARATSVEVSTERERSDR
jgi:heme/copper-type cytochrome/quinol oxidase subunit 2